MSLRLSAADSRALLRGMLAILAILIAARGTPALYRWVSEQHAAAATSQEELSRAERSIRHRPRTAAALATTQARLTSYDGALLPAIRPSAASAELAELVSEAADMSESGLLSIQLHVDSAGGSVLRRVTARATLTGDLESLVLFLHLLEEGPALISIRELDITGGDANVNAGSIERLRLQVEVRGIFASRAAAGRP